MYISGETVRYELSHMNLHCLQKPLNAFGNEMIKHHVLQIYTGILYRVTFTRE